MRSQQSSALPGFMVSLQHLCSDSELAWELTGLTQASPPGPEQQILLSCSGEGLSPDRDEIFS